MGRLKSFDIVFDQNKTVYYPGQRVKGKCVVNVKGDGIRINALKIHMKGVAKVHWTESRSNGNRFGAYTEHFDAEIEYFSKEQTLCGSDGSLVSSEVLPEGCHIYQFSFNLPQSGVSTSFEGKYGSIRYWMKAEMDKPWSFTHTTKKAFTLICPIDINRSEHLIPVEKNIEKTVCCWFCRNGPIALYCTTDRGGYCPGESIAISALFENNSRRVIKPRATLYQKQSFVARGKTRSKRSKLTMVTGSTIQPHKTVNWDAHLLKIPAVSPSINNCSLIKIDYSVRVSLQIPGSSDLSVELPVVVGTVPHRRSPSSSTRSSHNSSSLNRYHNHCIWTSPREYPPPPPSYFDFPPTYAECVEGSVDIADDEEGIMGDTNFTPTYTYVQQYIYRPPPAYSEVDPHPS